MASIAVHNLPPSGHGTWSEDDIDRTWRALLEVWPGEDARAARLCSLAIAAGLTPAELLQRARQRRQAATP